MGKKPAPRRARRRPTTQRTTTPLRSVEDIRASVTCTVREAVHVSAIKRTTLYRLLSDQVIESGLLRTGTADTRGTRLVNTKSLLDFCSRISTGEQK